MTPDKMRLRDFITKSFPNVEPWPSIEESCIYTVSTVTAYFFSRVNQYFHEKFLIENESK